MIVQVLVFLKRRLKPMNHLLEKKIWQFRFRPEMKLPTPGKHSTK